MGHFLYLNADRFSDAKIIAGGGGARRLPVPLHGPE
jgi:hypothetical protein